MSARMASYPWHALEHVPRDVAAASREARAALAPWLDASKLEDALARVLGVDARLVARDVSLSRGAPPSGGDATLAFETPDGRATIVLSIERALAAALVAKVVERPAPLVRGSGPLPAAVVGALAAIVHKVARVAHGEAAALRPLGTLAPARGMAQRVVAVTATVLLDHEAYEARVEIAFGGLDVARRPSSAAALARLADAKVELAVVAAVVTLSRVEVEALAPGDVVAPGEGCALVREGRALVGGVRLAAPGADVVIDATLERDGSFVVRRARHVAAEFESMSEIAPPDTSPTVADAVADVPIVLSIEIGSVAMSAREWASLAPGDVVTSGRRVRELVVLRAGGLEIARGELVDVEGEVGVRIREIVRGS